MDKWVDFFAPFFANREEARQFVEPIEALEPEHPGHRAKVMLHQTQRLISIAEDIPSVRKGKESLQLVFLMICAENIAKMHDNFDDEGSSKAYVRKFFDQFVVDDERRILETSFTTYDRQPLDLRAVCDTLYGVRCDVVHEGKYWDFHFHDGTTPMLNSDPNVIVSISLAQFRNILVRACIRAIRTYPGQHTP